MELEEKITGYRVLQLDQIACQMDRSKIMGHWAIMAVLAEKGEPKLTKKGEKFSIWKITDLRGNVISIFLFGKAFQELIRYSEGAVFCIANPKITSQAGKDGVSISLSISNPQQVLFIGISAHFGRCKAITSEGKTCFNFVDTSKSGYCQYHVKAAYIKTAANRPGLHHVTAVARAPSFISTPVVNNLSAAIDHKVNNPIIKSSQIVSNKEELTNLSTRSSKLIKTATTQGLKLCFIF